MKTHVVIFTVIIVVAVVAVDDADAVLLLMPLLPLKLRSRCSTFDAMKVLRHPHSCRIRSELRAVLFQTRRKLAKKRGRCIVSLPDSTAMGESSDICPSGGS